MLYPRCTMALAVSRRPFLEEVRVRFQVSACEICGDQNGTATGLSASTSLLAALCNLSSWQHRYIRHKTVLQVKKGDCVIRPVSTVGCRQGRCVVRYSRLPELCSGYLSEQ